MAHERCALFFAAALACAGGCATQTLPSTDTFSSQVIGTWRAWLASDASSFSDYVFSSDGSLATLRSVMDGRTVAPMQGAGVITSADGATSCAFGEVWRSNGATSILVDGTCNDGVAREIELDFAHQAAAIADVSVMAVGGEQGWMRPVTWRFQACALKACD